MDVNVCKLLICSEISCKGVRSNNSPKVVGKHRDGSISKRPPQPVPRPKHMHRQACSAVLGSSSLHAPLNNHRRHSGMQNFIANNIFYQIEYIILS